MEIKEGFDEKPIEIRIRGIDRKAELWINFEAQPKKETLSYMTLDELIDLKIEIENAIQDSIGLKS